MILGWYDFLHSAFLPLVQLARNLRRYRVSESDRAFHVWVSSTLGADAVLS